MSLPPRARPIARSSVRSLAPLLLAFAAGCGAASGDAREQASRAGGRDTGGRDAAGRSTAGPTSGDASHAATAAAVRVVDDGGHAVALPRPAARVVSLIPSVTEMVVALGAAPQLVGRTDYDVAPEVRALPSVGGGLDPSVEAIVALKPDLVVTWAHDAKQQTRARLAALGVPTFSLATEDTTDVHRGLARLGTLLGRDSAAAATSARLRVAFDAVRRSVEGRARPRTMFVLTGEPPMTAGPGTFVAQLVSVAGGAPAFDDLAQRWPRVSMEEVVRRDPDVLVLPVGPSRPDAVARLRATPGWRDLRAVREGRVVGIDANLVSRPGPHLDRAVRALRAAIHPELGDAAPSRAPNAVRVAHP